MNIEALRAIKVLHTLIWAFFASCIVAIPIVAWARKFDVAIVLIAVVFVEVLVVAFNSFACPLTAVAGRYTEDRRDNFDIYLPEWLARYNKTIFGLLYAGGLIFTAALWSGWIG